MRSILLISLILFISGCNSSKTQKSVEQLSLEYGYPKETLLAIDEAIKNSDNYEIYREFFIIKSYELLDAGLIEMPAIKSWGGWTQDTSSKNDYFLWGKDPESKTGNPYHVSNRIHINPKKPNYLARGRSEKDAQAGIGRGSVVEIKISK